MMAAGIAFYSLLSLFPALTALVSLWGLIANPQDAQQMISGLHGLVPEVALSLVSTQLHMLLAAGAKKLSAGLVVSLLFALWSANYATMTLMTALNGVYNEKEKRGFLAVTATAFALTAGLAVFGLLSLLLIAVLPTAINVLPVPATWRHAIGLVRWPLLAVLVVAVLAVLYRYAPSRERPRWRWVSWGETLATLLWMASSYGFSFYAARFAIYDTIYGSLSAVVVLMIWLFITAYVILLGAELDFELEH